MVGTDGFITFCAKNFVDIAEILIDYGDNRLHCCATYNLKKKEKISNYLFQNFIVHFYDSSFFYGP